MRTNGVTARSSTCQVTSKLRIYVQCEQHSIRYILQLRWQGYQKYRDYKLNLLLIGRHIFLFWSLHWAFNFKYPFKSLTTLIYWSSLHCHCQKTLNFQKEISKLEQVLALKGINLTKIRILADFPPHLSIVLPKICKIIRKKTYHTIIHAVLHSDINFNPIC